MSVLDHLTPLERRLASADFHPMSDWWKNTLASFYASGKRQWAGRVGRRGGKSSSLCRVGVLEGLYGDHKIPAGDIGVVAIISVSRDQSAERLRTVKAILAALGVKYKPCDGGIELESRPVAFKTFAASISGVSGFTCICAICDEVAKWKDVDTGSNPATEVLASLRPTMAGQPNAKIFLSSSPMGRNDAHAKAIDAGDTDFQVVTQAATWIARPSLTEQECRELEPDEDTFLREYGAIPFAGDMLSMFSESLLLAATHRGQASIPHVPGGRYFAAQDPATRSNEWSLAIGRELESGSVQIVRVQGWRAPKGGALDSDATMGEIAVILKSYGIDELVQDQWSFDALKSHADRHGIELVQEAMTQPGKVQMFDSLKRRFTDGTIEIPDVPILRSDLLGVRKLVSKQGGFSIELERQGGRHSDHAQSIALCASRASNGEASWVRAMSAVDARGGRVFDQGVYQQATEHYTNVLAELIGWRRKVGLKKDTYTLTESGGTITYVDADYVNGIARWKVGDMIGNIVIDPACKDQGFPHRARWFFETTYGNTWGVAR